MSQTYSYGYPGPPIDYPYETEKLETLGSVINQLPDNTNNEIDPQDVRDAIFTTWENIIFKPTTINTSSVEYIGIDQDWIREKILFGPKKRPDLTNVLDNNLLSNDVGDIFFYNSKTSSTPTDLSTKLVFLAGTMSYWDGLDVKAPFIESKVVDNGIYDYSLDLDIINNSSFNDGTSPTFSGHINIKSNYGSVYINNLRMPTYNQNLSGTTGQVLSLRKAGTSPNYLYFAEWKDPTASTAPPTVYFTDLNEVPQTIGGIQKGSTFSNVLIEDMMRRLLYPYIAPVINLTINNVLEFNNSVVPTQSFVVSVQNQSTYSATFNGTIPGTTINPTTFTIPVGQTVVNNGTFSLNNNIRFIGGTDPSYKTASFTVSVTDTRPNTVTYSFVMNSVLPFYYGTSNASYTNFLINTILGRTYSTYFDNLLTPFLSEPVLTQSSIYNKTVPLSTPGGSGKYIYFGYPSDLPPLAEIRDSNGFEVTSNFKTYSISGINSPNSRWSNRTYNFYIYVGPAGISPTTSTIGDLIGGWTENYRFNFGTQS